MAAIRILIVDDHKLFADAISPTLERLGFDEVEHVTQGEEALPIAIERAPDLALVDLCLPDKSGLVVGQELLEACPQTKVVVLTALNDQRAVQSASRAGFHGYMTKDSPVASFADSIRAVLRGEDVFPDRPPNGRSRDHGERDAQLLVEQLTDRERQVLALLVQGMSGERLSNQLGISPNTVRTHVQSILTKLQVHSRLEAASFAIRHGVGHARDNRAAG